MLLLAMGVGDRLGKSLDEMGGMSVWELGLWAAYYNKHDSLQMREEWRTARVCWAMVASQGGKVKIEDFVPDDLRPKADPEDAKRKLMAWCGVPTSARGR